MKKTELKKFFDLIDNINSDELRNVRLNGDFYKICKWLQRNGLCLKEKQDAKDGDGT